MVISALSGLRCFIINRSPRVCETASLRPASCGRHVRRPDFGAGAKIGDAQENSSRARHAATLEDDLLCLSRVTKGSSFCLLLLGGFCVAAGRATDLEILLDLVTGLVQESAVCSFVQSPG